MEAEAENKSQYEEKPHEHEHHHHLKSSSATATATATPTTTKEAGDEPAKELALAVIIPPSSSQLTGETAPGGVPTCHQQQCRVCQGDKDEELIELGCRCKGGLARAHRSCIHTWFRTIGSNKCEICREIAVNVPAPQPHPNEGYWVWRVDPSLRPPDRQRGCFSPLWVAFAILIGGLLLDVLISITLGVSALPVNIIIGVIIVLGLGTAVRLALEFLQEWNTRRTPHHRVDVTANLAYHPTL